MKNDYITNYKRIMMLLIFTLLLSQSVKAKNTKEFNDGANISKFAMLNPFFNSNNIESMNQ